MTARRMERPGYQVPCPVLCLGNFTLGGAGKTPAARAVAAILRARGETPVFLSRGYGGRLPGPVRVQPGRHAAGDVGDEPLLLARD
ncbi:tetraacyldisaccharide 4'-kinase, partial [Streptomyces caeruleatus]